MRRTHTPSPNLDTLRRGEACAATVLAMTDTPLAQMLCPYNRWMNDCE